MSDWMGSGHLLHLRWDLDKTYLRTDFDSVKDLIKTYRQKAEDKVAIVGARSLMQALLDPHERRKRRVTFIAVKKFEPGISARRRVLGGSWRLKR